MFSPKWNGLPLHMNGSAEAPGGVDRSAPKKPLPMKNQDVEIATRHAGAATRWKPGPLLPPASTPIKASCFPRTIPAGELGIEQVPRPTLKASVYAECPLSIQGEVTVSNAIDPAFVPLQTRNDEDMQAVADAHAAQTDVLLGRRRV